MTTSDRHFVVPPKIDAYLATLNRLYESRNESLLRELAVNGDVSIQEGINHDNWNGGIDGHAVTLTVMEDLYIRIMEQKDEMEKRLAADLNNLVDREDEYIVAVYIVMEPVGEDHWREETGIYRPRAIAAPSVAPEALRRIWGNEHHARVFLSHKATVKEQTSQVKQALARCGIAAFVAHEDIEPTEEWHREIERALFSMDALVALLSEDYHDSNWTDQEVGVAIGRGVPLIAVRLGMDPYGLMGKGQGLGGCHWSNPENIAVKVFHLLYKKLPDLKKWTGKQWEIKPNDLQPATAQADAESPF